MQNAVIVLPTYNEAKNIKLVIEKIYSEVRKIPNWSFHVLVVDSSSPDKTADIVEKIKKSFPNLHLIKTKKEGLGKAYVQGFKYSLENLHPKVLFEMDADLSHNPADIPKFITTIEKGADFVVGSRYIPGGSIPSNWGIERKIFSIFGNMIIRFGFMKFSITEWTNGFRAIKSWIIKKHLKDIENYAGYVFQVAILDNAVKSGANIVEIPVEFADRVEGSSKINTHEYIYQIIRYIFLNSPFIKFVIVGSIGFCIDFSVSYYLIDIIRSPVAISTIISAEMAIISNFFFNNKWSFNHKKLKKESSSIVLNFIKFNLISSVSLVIQAVGLSIATLIFGVKLWYVYKVLIIAFIIIPYSYFFYNKFVWKDK